MITREVLTARLADLRKQREQAIATVNALAGAIQFGEELLAKVGDTPELEKPEKDGADGNGKG